MKTKIITDKEKIIKYLKYKGISKNSFYKKTGLSVGFLDSGSSLGVDKLRLITDNYHDFNPYCLLYDDEEMIKNNDTIIPGRLIGKFENELEKILEKRKEAMHKAAGTDLSPPDGSSGPVQHLQEENNRLKEKIGLQQEIIELLKDKLAMHEEKYKEKQEKKAG